MVRNYRPARRGRPGLKQGRIRRFRSQATIPGRLASRPAARIQDVRVAARCEVNHDMIKQVLSARRGQLVECIGCGPGTKWIRLDDEKGYFPQK